MKRKIFIVMLVTTTTLSLYGCSKADIEMNPVKIEDSNTYLDTTLSDETNENEKQNTELTDKTLNENSAIDSTVKTTSETETKNTSANSELEGKEVDLKVEIEGSTETVKGKIHVSESGYQMAYDSERYVLSRELGVDSYMAKNPDPNVYPYVFLNISRYSNKKMDDYADQLEKEFADEQLSHAITKYKVIGEKQYKTIYLRTQTGYNWDSIIREYYILQDESDILLIETQYFLEAEEGHGARFMAMLDTFKIQ